MHMLICNTKLRSSILVFSILFCVLMMLFQLKLKCSQMVVLFCQMMETPRDQAKMGNESQWGKVSGGHSLPHFISLFPRYHQENPPCSRILPLPGCLNPDLLLQVQELVKNNGEPKWIFTVSSCFSLIFVSETTQKRSMTKSQNTQKLFLADF